METLPLISVAEILVGYQSRTRIKDDPAGRHKLILGRNLLSRHHLDTDSLMAFNPDRAPEPYTVRSGDILFQARGSEHFAYCIVEPPADTLASSSFYILRPFSRELSPHYLAWWINQPPAQYYLNAESQTANMPFVSKAVLSRLEVRIPDARTQNAIHRVNDLMQKELSLRKQIAIRRTQLIEAICMNSIQKKESNR